MATHINQEAANHSCWWGFIVPSSANAEDMMDIRLWLDDLQRLGRWTTDMTPPNTGQDRMGTDLILRIWIEDFQAAFEFKMRWGFSETRKPEG